MPDAQMLSAMTCDERVRHVFYLRRASVMSSADKLVCIPRVYVVGDIACCWWNIQLRSGQHARLEAELARKVTVTWK